MPNICPACRGLKIPGSEHRIDEVCTLCKGAGAIDSQEVCICGLPAVIMLNWNINYCGSIWCKNTLKAAVKKDAPVESSINDRYKQWLM